MKLLVGLGNPGSKYASHRHNIGFMAVDAIVRRHNFTQERKRFQALIHEGVLAGEKILVMKPQTFMNESGQAVGEAMRFYKLEPSDVTVLYDEIDLVAGKVKVKTGGGAAGHNGIRSITAHIGPDFHRARLGIGHPGDKALVHSHVLGDFGKRDHIWLDPLLDAVADEAAWLIGDHARFLNNLAATLTPPRPSTGTKTDINAGKAARKGKPSTLVKPPKEGGLAETLKAALGIGPAEDGEK